MEEKKNYRAEKVSLGEYLKAMKDIKLPRKYWVLTILYFVANIAMIPVGLMISTFSAEMIDAQGNLPTANLITFVIGYILFGVITAVSFIFLGVVSERINFGLRSKLWRKIIHTKQSCYDMDHGEALVSRVTTDCDYASQLYSTVISLITTVLSSIGYIISMFALSGKLSVYMLLLIPISILVGYGYSKLMYLIAQKKQKMLSDSTTYLIERTQELTLVKVSDSQEQEIEKGKELFDAQYKIQIQTGLMRSFYTALQSVFNILSIAIPFAVGAGLVKQGSMTAGQVVAFYAISGSVAIFFTNLIDFYGTVKQANGALARVTRTMELPVEDVEKGMDLDIPDEDIVFENVVFGYEENGNVLKGVTCSIPKNKVTALIGVNGSGKSTILNLIERLYEPKEGNICFGRTNIEEFSLHSWRKAFGVVAQGSPLMAGSIRENMCYGCEREVTKEEFAMVAKLSHVADFAEQLPDGYDTMLTAGGANLSGGQRQCIAIARAMMFSPDYLLLDEATSNLDAKREGAVIDALSELMKNRTTMIISHSLATIKSADYVIVLHDGKVDRSGTPKEILQESNNYLEKIMNRKGAIC